MKIARAVPEAAKTVAALTKLRELDTSSIHPPASDIDAAERPIPSGSDLAHKQPALAGVATTTLFGARLPDARALLEKRFGEIEQLVQDGEIVRCVFDLDNTLFDTRARTLHALEVFDAENGTSHAVGLDLRSIREDGRKTAIALGLSDDVVERIGLVWDREFWDPANLVHDTLMMPMIELVKEAQRRGAEVVFLTGRTEDHGFREPSRDQLERAGILVDDAHLLLKPSLEERTAPYKEAQMRALDVNATIGFFLTEGRRDMAHLAGVIEGFTGFLLDSSFEREGPRCKGVPVLPSLF